MNNQVKLIDQTKLLALLKDKEAFFAYETNNPSEDSDPDYCEGKASVYKELIEMIESGYFTPPVPTIKPIRMAHHPRIGLVRVLWVGEELASVEDSEGQKYDVLAKYLEVVE